MAVTLAEIVVADPPEAWREAGFAVDGDDTCRLGTVRVRLVGREHGEGIVGWSLRGLPDTATDDLDGVPTTASTTEPVAPRPGDFGADGADLSPWPSRGPMMTR